MGESELHSSCHRGRQGFTQERPAKLLQFRNSETVILVITPELRVHLLGNGALIRATLELWRKTNTFQPWNTDVFFEQ